MRLILPSENVLKFCQKYLCPIVAVLCVISKSAIGQAASTRRASVDFPGGKWSVVIPDQAELSDLKRLVAKSKRPVIIPTTISPGRWLKGIMESSGAIRVALDDVDLIGLLPGPNKLLLQSPGANLIPINFNADPIFHGDKDLAVIAVARRYDVPGLGSGTTSTLLVNAVTKRIILTFSAMPRSTITGTIKMANGTPYALKIERDDIYPSMEHSDKYEAAIDSPEESAIDSISIHPMDGFYIYSSYRVGSIQPQAFRQFSPRGIKLASTEKIPLFRFDEPNLKGWEIRGSGWGITDSVGEFFSRKGDSRYFADSKANGGEPATGTILSPEFVISGTKLRFLANGHSKKNYFALVDAKTEAELIRSPVPEKTGPFEAIVWDVSTFKGRKVRFMAVDNDTAAAYAWLAFDAIEMVP